MHLMLPVLAVLTFLTVPLVVVITVAVRRLLMLENAPIPWWGAAAISVSTITLAWMMLLAQAVTVLYAVVLIR